MDKLEDFVAKNRFTIAVIFPLIGAFTFIASAQGLLPDFLEFNPFFILFGTIVMRLPLISGLKPLINRKAAIGLLFITLYAYLIEYIGLKTGFPYGSFEYLIELGPMISGVPIGLPVFFIPLVLNSYILVNLANVESNFRRFIYSLGLVLVVDAILDPAAVALGIWEYSSGLYYGVPLSNYLGWILSASIVLIVLDHIFEPSEVGERMENIDYMLDDFVSFVFLWGIVNFYYLNVIPALLTFIIGMLLYRLDGFSFAWDS